MAENAQKISQIQQEAGTPLADTIYQALLDAIYEGKMPPGSTINEVALAAQFGVSRGPIREAIRRLQGIQLVTREPYIKAKVIELNAEAAAELFQLRMALEGMACFLATHTMSDNEIDTLIEKLEQNRQSYFNKSPGPFNFDFHEHIVKASNNKRIIQLLCDDLYYLLRIYRRHSGDVVERKEKAFDEHWQILRAIKLRDAHLAESLMRAHISHAAQHLFLRLEHN